MSEVGDYSTDVLCWNEVCGWKLKVDKDLKVLSGDLELECPKLVTAGESKFTALAGIEDLKSKLIEMDKRPGFYAVSLPCGIGKSTLIPKIVLDTLGREVRMIVPVDTTARALVRYVNQLEGEGVATVYPDDGILQYVSAQLMVEHLLNGEYRFENDCIYLLDEMHSSDCATRVMMALLANGRFALGMTASLGASATNHVKVKIKEFSRLPDLVQEYAKLPKDPSLIVSTRDIFMDEGNIRRGATYLIGRTYKFNRIFDLGARVTIVRRKGKFSFRFRSATQIELDQMVGRIGRLGSPGHAFVVKSQTVVRDVTKEIVAATIGAIKGDETMRAYLYTLASDLHAPVEVVEMDAKERRISTIEEMGNEDGVGDIVTSLPELSLVDGMKETFGSTQVSLRDQKKDRMVAIHDFQTYLDRMRVDFGNKGLGVRVIINHRHFPGRLSVTEFDRKSAQAILSGLSAALYTVGEYSMIMNVVADLAEKKMLDTNELLARQINRYIYNFAATMKGVPLVM